MTAVVEQELEQEEQEQVSLWCLRCNAEHNVDDEDIHEVNGAHLCDSCVSVCQGCDEYFDSDNPRLYYPDNVCYHCQDYYFSCDRCNGVDSTDYAHTVENDSTCTWCESCTDMFAEYCETCETYHVDDCDYDEAVINDYSYKPAPLFHNMRGVGLSYEFHDKTAYMGMELEVELPNDRFEAARFMSETLDGMAYMKHDGSLTNGFEIVTHPMTHDVYRNLFPWEAVERLRNEYGARSWTPGTCGIHIHISRTAFNGSAHMWRFAHFIHNNKRFVTTIAGRSSDHWASFDGNTRSNIINYVKNDRRYYPERYSAVNFSNDSTLEVRVFRGSLKYERIMSAIDFVDAVHAYTRNLPYQEVVEYGLDPARFVAWVRERQEKYVGLNYIINEYVERGVDFF